MKWRTLSILVCRAAFAAMVLLWMSAGTASAQPSCVSQCGIDAANCHAGCSTSQPCHATCDSQENACVAQCQPTPPPPPPPCKPSWKAIASKFKAQFPVEYADKCDEVASYLVTWHDANSCPGSKDFQGCSYHIVHSHAPHTCC